MKMSDEELTAALKTILRMIRERDEELTQIRKRLSAQARRIDELEAKERANTPTDYCLNSSLDPLIHAGNPGSDGTNDTAIGQHILPHAFWFTPEQVEAWEAAWRQLHGYDKEQSK